MYTHMYIKSLHLGAMFIVRELGVVSIRGRDCCDHCYYYYVAAVIVISVLLVVILIVNCDL